MDISIILATYKRPEILQRTLASFSCMECHDLKWDLWVVDNAGDAATEQVVNSWGGKLPIHYLVELAPGKNNALNSAISNAYGELFVFTDDDIIATQNWLGQLWEGVQRWANASVFGGRVLPEWPAGYEPHDLNNPYLIGAYAIANWDSPEGEYDPKKLFGANMAVRRRLFDEGWRFDSSIGPSQKSNYIMGSETEFVLRLVAAGHQPIYLPEALVYHQIRPEQMSFNWLKMRAYRAGLGSVVVDNGGELCGSEIFGVPRYLYRRLFECGLDYFFKMALKSASRVEAGMRFHMLRGAIARYRKIARGENV
ncbi:MAG: glycosyltransferase family 2 protein [Desulfobulbus sp.]